MKTHCAHISLTSFLLKSPITWSSVTVTLVAVAACSSGGQQFILTNSANTLVNEAAWELREIISCAMRDLFLNEDACT